MSRAFATNLVPRCLIAAAFSWIAGCSREATVSRPPSVAAAVQQTSGSCRECHPAQYQAWRTTDHALANRPVDKAADARAFAQATQAGLAIEAEFILGNRPLWQPLVAAAGGRWQPHEMAYDPAKQEWFNVFGRERRREGEWGHWTGRGMNWNSMCAHCHMTGYQRRYDVAADSYRSTWVEHGVGCLQCHGPVTSNHGTKALPPPTGPQPPFHGDRSKMMQTCAPCHARNELLTDRFQPGDSYHDHYRVVLPVEAATFHPDGQQRDEVFNWTSVLLSRMGHAGVSCLDCHDPHTTKTILPTTDNQLCMQCHTAPGRQLPSGVVATAIDPAVHTRHPSGSAGSSCVACHMPTTTYMQRAPRHDHGWLSPDPLMTRELGIPNACSRCHEDKGLDWNIEKTAELFGTNVLARQRGRARAVAAAQGDAPGAAERLVALLESEDIPAWRATYLTLLRQTRGGARGAVVARSSLQAVDPLERAAAVRYFGDVPDAAELLEPLLQDPVRVVRLEAAWALSSRLTADAPARRELEEALALGHDQPAGRVRLAQDLANRGQFTPALRELDVAASWDPFAPGVPETRGSILLAQGDLTGAGAAFLSAARLSTAPTAAALAFNAALAFAEAGRMSEAENAFRSAVQSDPALHRAWYNLGLLLARNGRVGEGITALREARRLEPGAADYIFAEASLLWQAGRRDEARVAAEQGRVLAPADSRFSELLRARR